MANSIVEFYLLTIVQITVMKVDYMISRILQYFPSLSLYHFSFHSLNFPFFLFYFLFIVFCSLTFLFFSAIPKNWEKLWLLKFNKKLHRIFLSHRPKETLTWQEQAKGFVHKLRNGENWIFDPFHYYRICKNHESQWNSRPFPLKRNFWTVHCSS